MANPWDEFSAAPTAPTSAAPEQAAPASSWDEFETTPSAEVETGAPGDWDEFPTTEAAPKTKEPPQPTMDAEIVVTGPSRKQRDAVRETEFVDTRRTVRGFDLKEDYKAHSALTPEEIAEYKSFFNPKKPPSAAKLQMWYRERTGANLGNAQEIIDYWKKTGKVSDQELIKGPVKRNDGLEAGGNHAANGLLFQYAPEVTGALDATSNAIGNLVGNGNGLDWQTQFENSADLGHFQLEQDMEDHPYWSIGGEVVGSLATIPVTGAVGEAAGLARLSKAGQLVTRGTAEGVLFGSGGAGPGHRLEGAGWGGATGGVLGVVGAGTGRAAQTAAIDAGAGSRALNAADNLATSTGVKIKLLPEQVGGAATRTASAASDSTVIGGALLNRGRDKVVTQSEKALDESIRSNLPNATSRDLDVIGHGMVDAANPDSFINLPTRLRDGFQKLTAEAQRLSGGKTLQQVEAAIARLPAGSPKLADLQKARSAIQRAESAGAKATELDGIVVSLTTEGDGVKVAQRLNAMMKKGGDAKRLQTILDNATPVEADGIRAAIMQNLGQGKGGFRLDSFLTNWKALSVEGKLRVLPGQARADLNDLATIATAVNRSRTGFNSGRGGGSTLNIQNILRMVDGFGAYSTGGGSAWASGAAGLVLSSPGVAKLLVRVGKTGATREALATRLTQLSTRVAAPEARDAVKSFADYVKSGGEPVAKEAPDPDDLPGDAFDDIDPYAFQAEDEEDDYSDINAQIEEDDAEDEQDGNPL